MIEVIIPRIMQAARIVFASTSESGSFPMDSVRIIIAPWKRVIRNRSKGNGEASISWFEPAVTKAWGAS